MAGLARQAAGVWLFCAHLSLLAASTAGSGAAPVIWYSKLQVNERCKDYGLPSLPTNDTCFKEGATAAGLLNVPHMVINGIGFTGCVYNTQAGKLMFGKTDNVGDDNTVVLDNLEYICQGVPTTTKTSTVTMSTVTTTTTTGFINKLNPGERCCDFMALDIPTEDFCFIQAAVKLGLDGKKTRVIDGLGFSGCVYNNADDTLMYGKTADVTPKDTMVLPSFEYICAGILQTSTTRTSSTSTASTSTASTSTATTSTLGPYALLAGNTHCHANNIHDITNSSECFNVAGPLVALSGKFTMTLNELGFSGCVYNSEAGTLMFGTTSGTTPQSTMTLITWHYVCKRQLGLVVIP